VKNNKKGFTLVELVIVIVIVGVLVIMAVPIYLGYTRRAMGTEGRALLGSVTTAQRGHHAEFHTWLIVPETSFSTILDVDARGNRFFTSFHVFPGPMVAGDTSFIATAIGSNGATGVTVTKTVPRIGRPTLVEAHS